MLILLLSTAMQSVTALAVPVPVTGVRQDAEQNGKRCADLGKQIN